MAILWILLGATGLALIFRDRLTALSGEQVASVVYGLMALLLVGGGFYARGADFSRAWLRDLVLWVAILAAIVLIYPFILPYLPARAVD